MIVWRIIALLLVFSVACHSLPAQADPLSLDRENLVGQDFSGQTLREAEFPYTDLSQANFANADMEGVVISNSILEGVNMQGADFTYGTAYLVQFTNADLRDALFVEAVMMRSTFDGADITGADFSYAVLDRQQAIKLCARASGTNSKTGVETRKSLNCR